MVAARIAHAGVDLAWHAPAACPDEAAMRAAILARLDAPADQIELAVGVDVVAEPEGFVAHLTAGDETRELRSASCSELADAIAVVVARAASEAHVTPPAPATSPPAAPPLAAPIAVAVAAPERATPWNAGVRVAALAGNGFSPEIGMAGEVAAWASYRRFAAELAADRWWATTAQVGNGDGVEVGLSAVALRVGWTPIDRLRTWVVGELGSQDGTGVGFAMASSGSGRWIAAGGGVGTQWPIAPHVAAVAGAELEVALERTSFAIGPGATVYEAPRLAERLRLGLELSWR
jgi:hypothetical protein